MVIKKNNKNNKIVFGFENSIDDFATYGILKNRRTLPELNFTNP